MFVRFLVKVWLLSVQFLAKSWRLYKLNKKEKKSYHNWKCVIKHIIMKEWKELCSFKFLYVKKTQVQSIFLWTWVPFFYKKNLIASYFNKIFFASFLWKSVQINMVEWMGLNFDFFSWFPENSLLCVKLRYSVPCGLKFQNCIFLHIRWNYQFFPIQLGDL